ncbi:Uncharacterised protein [uncultured archaeon]|nr:Uncharacterised protein [uncultured archaeon]
MLTQEIEERLMDYLKEDFGTGDITSAITPSRECLASINVNEPCTLAGMEEVSFLMRYMGLKVKPLKADGEAVKKREKVLEAYGESRKILSAERVCLNILGRMSGVASMCAKARKICVKETIALTRKTVPGFQLLDKKAGQAAGAWTHRKNLAEMMLLKDNHLRFFAGSIEAAKTAKASGKMFEIEAENAEDALAVLQANPDMIMLDNFNPQDAKKTISKLRKAGFHGKIELSGGITLKNLKTYCNMGADIISMGELTKKARIVDFSLDITDIKA